MQVSFYARQCKTEYTGIGYYIRLLGVKISKALLPGIIGLLLMMTAEFTRQIVQF